MFFDRFGHRTFITTGGDGKVAVPLLAYLGLAVIAASTAPIADLSAASTTQDGVTLVEGNTFLAKDQADAKQNGVYVVDSVSGTTCVLKPLTNFETGDKVPPGFEITVLTGTANAGVRFKLTGAADLVVGTDVLTFEATSDTMTVGKRTVTVGQADLTANVNGTAQAINLGAALPANARPIAVALKLATPFTGGGAASVSLDIGTAGDPTAIVAGADVKSAAVDGQASTCPAGKAPNRHYAVAGAQLLATFTPDGGAKLVDLTAGSITIDVSYIVQA